MKIFNKLKLIFSDSTKINIARYAISLIATLLIGYFLVIANGANPSVAVREIFKGAFGSKTAIGNTIHWATTCSLVGIAAAVAFKSGVFNCGLEGQLYFGALVAACVGYMVELPPVVHAIVCIISGGLAGLLYALIPALLKLFFKIDEVISTLLLNYIAMLATEYITLLLLGGNSATPSTSIMTPFIYESAELTPIIKATNATTGILIAIAIIFIVYLLYKYTLVGYEMKMVGQNLRFSKAGGVHADKMFVVIFLVSGLIAGVAGATEVLGVNHRFIANFSTNLGWDGIMVTRVATNNPIGVLLVSFIWSAFKAGAMQMERATTMNRYVVNLLQALFVLFISIDYGMLYKKYKDKKIRKSIEKEGATK
jgi:general nucleoside transport system permease protein